MFHLTPPKPTPAKKVAYLILTTILGILLTFLIYAFAEIKYLEWSAQNNHSVVWYGSCILHPVFRIGLLFVGAIGGFFLGKVWWRKVYIEQYWYNKFKNQK